MIPEDTLASQEARLLACVHCGLCLDACPTYTRLGDEADSPRGRILFMRAVGEGRLDPDEVSFQTHIDRCLGCRACEPVCPSGVQYGFLLERARATVRERHGRPLVERMVLAVMANRPLTAIFGFFGRVLRSMGLARRLAQGAPLRWSRVRLALAMLAATRPGTRLRTIGQNRITSAGTAPEPAPLRGPRVALLKGCAQRVLFRHVNEATRRVLYVNSCKLVTARGQRCCGALHAHGGDLETARKLALANIAAFEKSGAERIVVNAAGCGAMMKEYGELFEGTAHEARAHAFSERVRDVSELLAELGPATGGAMPVRVAYDPPCHLVHAQRIVRTPLDVLERAVPGLTSATIERAEECCGGAGTYGLSQPGLGSRILESKSTHVRAASADLILTANPGCIMQIGASLILAHDTTPVIHPIEVLDESYRRANEQRG
jgi:glycolate oxidase iron-sulfur subunit